MYSKLEESILSRYQYFLNESDKSGDIQKQIKELEDKKKSNPKHDPIIGKHNSDIESQIEVLRKKKESLSNKEKKDNRKEESNPEIEKIKEEIEKRQSIYDRKAKIFEDSINILKDKTEELCTGTVGSLNHMLKKKD